MNARIWNDMARIICYTITVLLLCPVACTGFPMDANEASNYILLVQEVHKYYGTSCIVIVHSDNHADFNQSSLTHSWTRAFSQRGILTAIASISDLSREAGTHRDYITRPLYVVVLATKETMNELSMATKRIDISYPVWLVMFLPYPGNPLRGVCEDPVGNPFDLSFDTVMLVLCYDSPFLKEWYALRDNRTRVTDLATWTPGERFELITTRSLYERRNDMFGERIRVSVIQDSLFNEVKNGELSLFIGEIMQELSKLMNFTIEVVSIMPTYGSWSPGQQFWTGVIGEVASNRADVGIAEFSMTEHRLDAVDFILPLIMSRNNIYFRKPDGSPVEWFAYFKTFDTDIWTTIVCLIATTPILLTVMKMGGRAMMRTLADNYISVWGIYCQQALSEFPNESSMRLAFLSIFLSALIISSAYSAALISFLTVSTINLPFSSVEEFARYSSYRLIVFRNSAEYDMIISADDGVFSNVRKLLRKEEDLPLTVREAFAQVCTGKVGFYVAEAIRNAVSNLPCETAYIETGRIDTMSPVLNKGSPYRDAVNYHLQRFKDNGMLSKLSNKFLVTRESSDKGYPVVSFGGVVPLLAMLAGGTALSCVILILEKIYYKLSRGGCKDDDDTSRPDLSSWKQLFHRGIPST